MTSSQPVAVAGGRRAPVPGLVSLRAHTDPRLAQ